MMQLKQALTIAELLVTWELESPQVMPPPEAWQAELKQVRKVLQAELEKHRGPVGEFFMSAECRRKNIRTESDGNP